MKYAACQLRTRPQDGKELAAHPLMTPPYHTKTPTPRPHAASRRLDAQDSKELAAVKASAAKLGAPGFHAFAAHADDHCETPPNAYADVAPILRVTVLLPPILHSPTITARARRHASLYL